MEHNIRPWGQILMLDNTLDYKVNKIIVDSGACLPYQFHHHHSEILTIVFGVARITLNGVIQDYKVGDTAIILQGVKHRIENPFKTSLIFFEVQHGSYLREDDTVLIEEEYQESLTIQLNSITSMLITELEFEIALENIASFKL